MTQNKKLYRTVDDKVVAGVAGGLAEYFDVDVVIFRLLFVLLVLFGGGGLLAYIVMWIVIPPKPVAYRYAANPGHTSGGTDASTGGQQSNTSDRKQGPTTVTPETIRKNSHSNTSLIAGIILIVMGLLFLINRLMPWVDLGNFWPVLLIIGGFLIIDPNILKSSKNKQQ
jgi:phage shock protein C